MQRSEAAVAGCPRGATFAGDDAAQRATALMKEREQFYVDSDIRIDTAAKSVEYVAAEVLEQLAKGH